MSVQVDKLMAMWLEKFEAMINLHSEDARWWVALSYADTLGDLNHHDTAEALFQGFTPIKSWHMHEIKEHMLEMYMPDDVEGVKEGYNRFASFVATNQRTCS